MSTRPSIEAEPLLPIDTDDPLPSPIKEPAPAAPSSAIPQRTPWLALALASGACAAFNGVFAKLTTTSLTSSLATSVASALHLPPTLTELPLRLLFFLLNLAFNAVMWTLFTAALTRADSTTRVSIVNTSANFVITALAGWAVFGESLPGLWWVGAGGCVVGCVVIGRREEGEKKEEGGGGQGRGGGEGDAERDDVDGRGGGGRERGEEREGTELI